MKNGFQTQNNNVNPTAEQIKRRNKLHKEATKQADKSFSAACLAPVRRLIQTENNSRIPHSQSPCTIESVVPRNVFLSGATGRGRRAEFQSKVVTSSLGV
jgi:hypothetical protein